MRKLIVVVLAAGIVGVLAAVYSVLEIAHRQNHTAHVAKVAAAKSTKAAKTAAKTATKTAVKNAVKAATKTATKKVKTAQEQFNDELYKSQLSGCRRGNVLRSTVNRDTLVIRQFMLIAAAQYAKVKTPFAQQRAADYRSGAAQLRLVPLPNCGSVAVRPPD